MNDHDLLIQIDTKLSALQTGFSNHLAHHFRYNILAYTVSIGAIVSLILIIVRSL